MTGALLAALIAGMVIFGGLVIFVAKVLVGLVLLAAVLAVVDHFTVNRDKEVDDDDDII